LIAARCQGAWTSRWISGTGHNVQDGKIIAAGCCIDTAEARMTF
jgi:hypothetical protein